MNTIKDLDGLLGLKVRWEKRKEKVWVLTMTGKGDKFLKPIGLNDERLTVNQLSYLMNQQPGNPYVFDETKYNGGGRLNVQVKSWLDLVSVKPDRTAVNKMLANYGLTLKEEERLVDQFVFTEINDGLLVEKPVQSLIK